MPRLNLMLNRKDLPVDLCRDCAAAVRANPNMLARALGMNPVFVEFSLAHNMWSEHDYGGGGYSCQCCATPLKADAREWARPAIVHKTMRQFTARAGI